MDRRLGGPLPHQLSNPTRAHPCAINLWQEGHAAFLCYAVLTSVSRRYPPHKGRLLTRYSPVRHWSGAEAPSPFDLNVLCTPPAFILSQDQTLEQIVSQPFPVKILVSRACLALILFRVCLESVIDSSFLSSKKFRDFRTKLLLVLLSPVVQLSMICLPSFGQPDYYITTVSICQEVFQNFFQVFFVLFFPRSGCARIVYHTLPRLSRGFSKVFSTFFAVSFRCRLSLPFCRVPVWQPLFDSRC